MAEQELEFEWDQAKAKSNLRKARRLVPHRCGHLSERTARASRRPRRLRRSQLDRLAARLEFTESFTCARNSSHRQRPEGEQDEEEIYYVNIPLARSMPSASRPRKPAATSASNLSAPISGVSARRHASAAKPSSTCASIAMWWNGSGRAARHLRMNAVFALTSTPKRSAIPPPAHRQTVH